jgi:type III secretion protein N (ATPase)
VERLGVSHRVQVSEALLGQVLDGFGRPIAGEGPSAFVEADLPDTSAVLCEAPLPTERPRINRALATGVRSIDGLLTLGEGQRVGLFAGAGCGKTTLLAEIARNVECDVIVFGLIGERGRNCASFSIMNWMNNCVPRPCWCAPRPTAPAWSARVPRSRPRRWPKVSGARASGCCC